MSRICDKCGDEKKFAMRTKGGGDYCNEDWPEGAIRDWGRWGEFQRTFTAWREDHIWYGLIANWIRRKYLYPDPDQCPVDGYRLPHVVMGWRTDSPLNHEWRFKRG